MSAEIIPLYTTLIAISCAVLVSLGILVIENARFSKHAKLRFCCAYSVIIVAAVSEWAAIMLNGAPSYTIPLHSAVKAADYIFTPLAAVMFVYQVAPQSKLRKYLIGVQAFNVVLQIVSAFTGWTYYIDAANYYHHGPLFFLYTAVFCVTEILWLVQFWLYGRKYSKQNRASLFAIAIIVFAGVLMQEFINSSIRVVYVVMACGSALLFIHYSEFTQVTRDAAMSRQKQLLETDALTGVLSRFAYKEAMAGIEAAGKLPQKFTAFEIDVNSLKTVNDTMGHECGDELLRGAAETIAGVLGVCGSVYRTGGDEFAALTELSPERAQEAALRLRTAASHWNGENVHELSLAVGWACAAELPDLSAEELVREADARMYADKEAYYNRPDHDRRRPPSVHTFQSII